MVTPFAADGSIDWAMLTRLVEWYIAAGCVGVCAAVVGANLGSRLAVGFEQRGVRAVDDPTTRIAVILRLLHAWVARVRVCRQEVARRGGRGRAPPSTCNTRTWHTLGARARRLRL